MTRRLTITQTTQATQAGALDRVLDRVLGRVLRCALGWTLPLALLTGCASAPPAPDWQINAHGALARFVQAYLVGNTRVEAAEFNRARVELSATGDRALVARAELTRCALQVASLVLQDCEGFEALRGDSPAAQVAYAHYLAGRPSAAQAALLPAQHRALAQGTDGAAALRAMQDPLARLIGAGVLLRTGRATPEVVTLALDTASAQGWRRPLLAWLGLAAQRADQLGQPEQARALRRRMDIVSAPR